MQQKREAFHVAPDELAPVTCVVLNWNGWQDTVMCVQSLLHQEYKPLDILIVDNQSTNDSVEQLKRALPQIELIVADTNRGFAAGCNLGIGLALRRGAAYVWLLNNDTAAPPSTLTALVNAAVRNSRAGLVGTVLMQFEQPKRLQVWGGGTVRRGSGYNRHFCGPRELGPEAYLTFASVLIRRDVFTTAGLLDEGFFMYYEDADFCFRARNKGWTLTVAANTAVLHKEGGSTKRRRKTFADRVVTSSGLRFLTRHGGRWAWAVFLFLRLGRRLLRLDLKGLAAVLKGVHDWRDQATQEVLPSHPHAWQTRENRTGSPPSISGVL